MYIPIFCYKYIDTCASKMSSMIGIIDYTFHKRGSHGLTMKPIVAADNGPPRLESQLHWNRYMMWNVTISRVEGLQARVKKSLSI